MTRSQSTPASSQIICLEGLVAKLEHDKVMLISDKSKLLDANALLTKQVAEQEKQLEAAREVVRAAMNLIAQKGRHNTEIGYNRLAAAIKDMTEAMKK